MSRISAYILTVESIAERKEVAEELRKDLQAYAALEQAEIVPAIYWRDDGVALDFLATNPQFMFAQEYLARCKQGQLCATLSHIQMWKVLLASDADAALFCEDDIYISDPETFQQVLDEIPRHPEIDFLRIHQYSKFRAEILESPDPGLFVEDPSLWGFAAYYLSRKGAEKLLQRFEFIDDHVDMIIPRMGQDGSLYIRTVKPVVVEHQAFTGAAEDLQKRHPLERAKEKLQQVASTIWTSPLLYDAKVLHGQISGMTGVHADELRENGHTTLQGVFKPATVAACREQVLKNLALFRNTRPSSSALHLAGFHRFPELESLHTQLAGNPVIRRLFEHLLADTIMQTIGLSDITINRSQCWHKDLLRGEFSTYLHDQDIWGENGGGVYKVLFYLQAGSSLKVIHGSHKVPIPLQNDRSSEPDEQASVKVLPVEEGDVVIMDIRMSHRGASEEAYAGGQYDDDPRILISTAMGAASRPLTRAMEIGNFHRLTDWMERNP